MAGKVIVQGLQQGLIGGKTKIFVDSVQVGIVDKYEKLEVPINKDCVFTCKVGLSSMKEKDGYRAKDNTFSVLQLINDRVSGKVTFMVVKEEAYSEASEEEKIVPIYDLVGCRGRTMQVFEDKCIIATKAGIGSFITGNVSDGAKTINYSDVIGVQCKKAGFQIGYLQLETASSTMNNKGDNFFNENSFTFEEPLNYQIDEVADYIRRKIEETKRQKNAPIVVAGAVSSADELKKFKELLDMGIITQEEFDAKKKQLLGL